MGEINKNTYLDLSGLKRYDELIKGFIANGHTELAEAIKALNDKLGSLEFEGSDDNNLTEIVDSIYTSIAEIVEAQEELKAKDDYLAAEIQKVVDDLKFVTGGDSENEATIGEINAELKNLKNSVDKVADDVADATAAIEILNGEGEGSVKKAADDAQAAAIAAAASKAEAAEQNAKEYANTLVTDEEGKVKFDAAGTAKDFYDAMDTRVTVLEEIDHNKLVADAIAAVVAGAESEFDTLKEVADWINSDTTGAAALQIAVDDHTKSIDALEVSVEKDIKDLEDHMIAADAALKEVDGRLDALEAFEETHASIDLNDIDGLFSENAGSEPEE